MLAFRNSARLFNANLQKIFNYKYTTYNFKNKKFYNSFPSDTLQKQCSQTLVFTTAKSDNRKNKNLRALNSI